ncbi:MULTISPECIES: PP2C family protein-serine/threonine phosphatase [unclassified Rhodococcus (in: high G+C Gram-positive bacteria)]|uniref:PP2C family protein-serine/threonine phosphatase n=1 Tax=unclassified Rhodococcus (in: high G+C Gram-positive bacteria) TaxID=192944 RepID=UPI000AD44D54|nr:MULTISPECIES: GAF domain-containing SpoIIE family protein phosphatase [unclassified Rhodococcus (in: high G+C Gram-positive bacteria)]
MTALHPRQVVPADNAPSRPIYASHPIDAAHVFDSPRRASSRTAMEPIDLGPDPAHSAELARLAALARYDVEHTAADGAFARIARLAARWFDAPYASVSIIDADLVRFTATYGDGLPDHTERHDALCTMAMTHDGPFVAADTLADPSTAGSAFVRGELGIRFYAGAPIVTADGFRLGTVNVYDVTPRSVSDDRADILMELADIAMDEFELRLSAATKVRAERELRTRAESDAAIIGDYAAVLQRTLLPPSLPTIEGLTLASHYHASSPLQVGGDFYDVFALGNDRWAFFLGDVQGHGAGAAAVTSLVRYTLRAAALHHEDPTEGLAELNRLLLMDTSHQRFCTVLFGFITPDPRGGFRVTLATGGHPPALLLDPARGEVHEIRSSTGMFVGALENATFSSCSFRLEEGQTLLLYTDGITEARPDGRTMFGEDGLAQFTQARLGLSTAKVVEDLVALIPDLSPIDDIALLALGA